MCQSRTRERCWHAPSCAGTPPFLALLRMQEVTPTCPGIPPPAPRRALQAGQTLGVHAQGHGILLSCPEQCPEHLWQEAASGVSLSDPMHPLRAKCSARTGSVPPVTEGTCLEQGCAGGGGALANPAGAPRMLLGSVSPATRCTQGKHPPGLPALPGALQCCPSPSCPAVTAQSSLWAPGAARPQACP